MAEDEEHLNAVYVEIDRFKAEEPERWNAAQEKLQKLMSTVGGVLNLMHAFAAPRYLAQANAAKPETQQQLLALFDDFLNTWSTASGADETDTHDHRLPIHDAARRMRALLETWEFSHRAPESIVQTAREFLRAFGICVSDEEWDQWEGPKDESSSPTQ